MNWKRYLLGDFLVREKEAVKILPQEKYALVTIRMYHKGVVKRNEVKGTEIKSSALYQVKAGQFILSGIDARNGAFGIVPNELEGAVVTNDFWTHNINTSIIDIDFFYWFTTTPQFYQACIKASEGTTNRQRLQADKFYSFDVYLPDIDEQKAWSKSFAVLKAKHEELEQELNHQQTYLTLLRQTILQEAVQGKLSEPGFVGLNDFAEEQQKYGPLWNAPATELLAHIKAEKEKSHPSSKSSKSAVQTIAPEEVPFALPEGWAWCRLGEIIELKSGVTLGKTYKEDLVEVPYLRVANVQRGFIDISHLKNIKVPKFEIEKYILVKGDLCIVEGGDWDKVGRCSIWEGEVNPCIHQNHIFRLRFPENVSVRWSELFLNSSVSRRYFENCSKQTTNLASINKTQLSNSLFPLPPLYQQHRIVAKVQALQQKLNALENQVQQSRRHAQALLQMVLKEAFAGKENVYVLNEEISLAAEE